jgi:colicin import membrane protein
MAAAHILNRPPEPPGKTASVLLAIAMHVLLGAFLIYGIRWQTQHPEAVSVELVSAPPVPAPAVEPKPQPTPPAEPVPKVEPKPVPKPAPPPPKPDIAVKEKEKPKPVPKEAPPPKADPFAEQLRRDSEQVQKKRAADAAAAELDKLKADQASASVSRAQAAWQDKIRGKIRGKIFRPPGATGNPEAIYEITLLPDGSLVGEPRLRKSTGNAALDAAIERAIKMSSPLPKPDDPSAFVRELKITFRPLEE